MARHFEQRAAADKSSALALIGEIAAIEQELEVRRRRQLPPRRRGAISARARFGAIARVSCDPLEDDRSVARYVERCRDCTPGTLCRWHVECRAHRDARIAADIGVGWARFVWLSIDIRRPWPIFEGRCAAIATRLVSWLVAEDEQERRLLVAEVCSWRAGITWETLQAGSRDRPFRASSASGVEYVMPGLEHVVIRFRPRRSAAVVPLARRGLASSRERAGRFRAAQGLHVEERESASVPWRASGGHRR